jgi:sugar O-acyltransferase (sialic acid O-acetyltransferase NeuD family)
MTERKVKNIIVVGSAGHAKVAMDIIEREGKYRIVGLIDAFKKSGETSFDYTILGKEEDLPELSKKHNLGGCLIAVGDNWKRHLVVEKLKNIVPKIPFISAVHPSTQIARNAAIGDGTVIMAGAIVNSDTRIGRFCIINTNASIDHDCIMEDFSSLAPGVTVGGSVKIGAFTAISLGVNVIHRRQIGKHTVVGSGSVVINDVPAYSVAYGFPAKVIRERKEGDEYL